MNDIILNHFNASKIIVGHDHHFGFNREGSPQFLKKLSIENKYEVEIIEPIKDSDMIISSTRIRESIQNGFVRRASFELGWVFGFEANVVAGSGRGKGLGFPTANFLPIEKNQLIINDNNILSNKLKLVEDNEEKNYAIQSDNETMKQQLEVLKATNNVSKSEIRTLKRFNKSLNTKIQKLKNSSKYIKFQKINKSLIKSLGSSNPI